MIMLKIIQIATNVGSQMFDIYVSQGINDILNSRKGVGTGGTLGTWPLFSKIQATCLFAAHQVAVLANRIIKKCP